MSGRIRVLGLVLLVPFLALALGGCVSMSAFSPPDWAWFDVVLHPGGGIPASLGYYGGVALWSPVGVVLSGLLPAPVDGPVGWGPGEVLGTTLGIVLGAPFHLVALPFGGGGPVEEEPPAAAPAPAAEGEPQRPPGRE